MATSRPGTIRRSRSSIPGVNLPSTKITPVYRTDGSGDTFAFTDYLSSVSPEFKSKVGVGTEVKFPTGIGGDGSDGIAAALSKTDGAIGYLTIAYVTSNSLNYALLQNAAGNYPKADIPAINAAAATAKSVPPGGVSIVNPPASAKNAWPDSTFTYVIVPTSTDKADALKKFITYALGPGQSFAEGLGVRDPAEAGSHRQQGGARQDRWLRRGSQDNSMRQELTPGASWRLRVSSTSFTDRAA